MSDTPSMDGVPTLPDPQSSSVLAPSLPPQDAAPRSPDSTLPFLASAPPPPPPLVSRPTFEYQAIPPLAPGQLPRGWTEVSPWGRLGARLLDTAIYAVTLGIGWLIWAAFTAGGGQTPAKRMLGHTVIAADTHRPVGFARMFWVRGVLCYLIVPIVIVCTLGLVLFMPFWNKHNQNIWDRISVCYVVRRP
jgi:uncharacterized RDD family membrane protein YckC